MQKNVIILLAGCVLILYGCGEDGGPTSGTKSGQVLYQEDFDSYIDGTLPDSWVWTGDPTGGGAFTVKDKVFGHTKEGDVYYFYQRQMFGDGTYEFDVDSDDTSWIFAWRITSTDPSQGEALRLQYNIPVGSNNLIFSVSDWSTLEQHPHGQFMWHNASSDTLLAAELSLSSGPHHIKIEDDGKAATFRVDDVTVLGHPHELDSEGFIGLGSQNALFIEYDNISVKAL